jgi:hypothetical protein
MMDGRLTEAEAREELSAAEVAEMRQRWYQPASTLAAGVKARLAVINNDGQLTDAGRATAQTEEGARVKPRFEPIKSACRKVITEDARFQKLSPFLQVRDDGSFHDTRQRHAPATPEAALIAELAHRDAQAYLLKLSAAERGRRLREAVASGDADGLYASAVAAPSFMNLIDEGTQRFAVERAIEANGLGPALAKSAFRAGAAQHLIESINALLISLGVSPDREP